MTQADRILDHARAVGVVRSKDLAALGIPRQALARLHRRGRLDRVGRGLYVLPEASVTEHHTLAEVARRVPSGVICLLSALRFHGLTTQDPFDVWVAIAHKSWRPQTEALPVRIVYASGEARAYGVQTHDVEGVSVQIYSPAKTVADCFKYRSRVGLDVAIEALRDYRASAGFDADALWRAAQVCRVATLMRPYLEAVA